MPTKTRKRVNSAKSKESEAEICARIKRLPIDTRNRAEQAKKRLGVTKEQLDGCRKITPLLREVGLTVERVCEILEGDGSDEAVAFVTRYRKISQSDRAYLSIEEICLAAGLTTRRLWEVIAGARLEQSQEAVKLMVAEAQPKVMAAAIKAATDSQPIVVQGVIVGHTNGDMKATELIWKATGMLPTPKGATVAINLGNQQQASDDDEPDEVPLQDMDSFLKGLQETITKPQLHAPKDGPALSAPVEAEYIDVR
jgi:hypothetical protein